MKPRLMFMRSIQLIIIFLSTAKLTYAQDFQPRLKSWSTFTIIEAKLISYNLFSDRKNNEVVFYSNLARMDGRKFVQTILLPYLQFTGDTTYSEYVESLISQLKKQPRFRPLKHDLLLENMAKNYATSSGKAGIVGHDAFDERFAGLLNRGKQVGENCAYGEPSALGVVIQLLVDEGVESLGHRYNILSPSFKRIGVGFAPHLGYNINCVEEFSD